MNPSFLYFAYGSNMSLRRLTAANRAPSARPLGPACISGHRLTFDKLGADGSAKADCERTADLTDKVHGGLFEIEATDLPALDHAEGATGAHSGYRRTAVVVWTADGPRKALTYLATRKQPGLLPHRWYIRHVLVGARELGLPADHVDAIARHPTLAKSDPVREAEELALYATLWIRHEAPSDSGAIHALTLDAFRDAPHTSHTEQFIVDALRQAGALTLSLVAEVDGVIVGHVAVSPVGISDGSDGWHGLGPISVVPTCQRGGIGSMLMRRALDELHRKKASGCVLLGDPAYYSRFGFKPDLRLVLPGVPAEYFHALHIDDTAPEGIVRYHAAFDAHPDDHPKRP